MHTNDALQIIAKPVEYIVYCDESSDKGSLYVDFYGGSIVRADKLPEIEAALNAKKKELNLHGEIKWTKVTEQYLERYQEIATIHPNFNIGVSTGAHGRCYPHWDSPYEHWVFEAQET